MILSDTQPRALACGFQMDGTLQSVTPFGTGHINDTFRAATDRSDYVLQRISPVAFHDPEAVMHNIVAVLTHLRGKVLARGGDPERETLTLIPTTDGANWLNDSEGGIWRMYRLIHGAKSYVLPETEAIFTEAGRAFGSFAAQLGDFPADQLDETIPHFHDTPRRLEAFRAAVRADRLGRASEVEDLIRFVENRAGRASALMDQLAGGVLPLRVTHNDTKLDNVMMDEKTDRSLCVIDLDTVMPGLTAYDFGDAIRFGANTAVEDERDLTKVRFSLDMYRAWCRGYLAAVGDAMNEAEKRSLPLGAWMMTFECGTRFLTDYLDGDRYFHIAMPDHNRVRAANQFALLRDMERYENEMLDAVLHPERGNA